MSRYLDLADHIVSLVGDRAEAEVRVEAGPSGLTRFANSFIHQNVAEELQRVHLKLVVDGRVAAAETNTATEDNLVGFIDGVLEAATLVPVDEDWPGLAPPAEIPGTDHYDEATAAATPAERAAVVRAFVDAGDGMDAAGYCDTEAFSQAIANSAGLRAEGRATRATLDGIHQTESSAGSGHQTAARLSDIDGAAAGDLAAQRARDSVEAVDLAPGEYEVVLAPEAVATIAIFLGFYGFNGRAVNEGQSFVEVGAGQFDEAISIWDDAFDSRTLGIGFDAEGTPKRRIEFITAGTTMNVAHDRRTAGKAGAESTGHAIPGGGGVGAIPINTFIGTGDETIDELIGGVERGLYVATFNYCRILDPRTQVVTGLTRNGTFLIENGAIAGAVGNMRFTQSFVEALGPGKVLGVESQNRFADSEFGPGLIVAPSLRLAAWNFTGGAAG
jgi:predicted Zn-dependent protease